MPVDLSMYSYTFLELEGDATISLSPEYPVSGATYAIVPALPSSAEFNTETGAITGNASGFGPFNTYTIIQSNAGAKTKFYLTIATNNAEPVEPTAEPTVPVEPTTQPTAEPTAEPTVPVEPTQGPSDDGKMTMIIIIVVIVIVVVLVVVIVLSLSCKKSKKSLKTVKTSV